jgi:hypothetical protein
MKKFAMGAIAGASALALSVPIALQLASAASSDGTSSSVTGAKSRPVPTQACVQEMASRDDHFLQTVDAMIAAQKAATLEHKNALIAAAQLTDDTQRMEALKAAEEKFRTAMKTVMEANKPADDGTTTSACGNMMKHGGMMMMHGGPGGPGMFKFRFGGHMRGAKPADGEMPPTEDTQPTQQN